MSEPAAARQQAALPLAGVLYRRVLTGRRAEINISMLESLVEWTMAAGYTALYAGRTSARVAARHSFIVPYGAYRVGDGSRVNVAVQNNGQWCRLCAVGLRSPTLAEDPRFRTTELRLLNRGELEPLIEQLWEGETRASVEARLAEADVPFGRSTTCPR
jgi:crotonobetainyl-CoA:carnitine CoA-transferase CaiB-like acyl-CoA transferase